MQSSSLFAPKNKEILKIWSDLRESHKQFHENGGQALAALKRNDQNKAREYYNKAEEVSRALLNDFEKMIRLAEQLERNKMRVFEE